MSPPEAALIVVAAGRGERLGAGRNKALADLGGRPLVDHALRRLLELPWLSPAVLVGHPDDRADLAELAVGWPRAVVLVDGGERRQDSVAAGLAALADRDGLVLVHDAARPFPPVDRLAELAARAGEVGAAVLAVPVADTIKEAREDAPDRVARTLARDRLWSVQTPQAFRVRELAGLLAEAGGDVTDEAGLYETAGRPVAFVAGRRSNFKVTTAEDLALAEALLVTFHERSG